MRRGRPGEGDGTRLRAPVGVGADDMVRAVRNAGDDRDPVARPGQVRRGCGVGVGDADLDETVLRRGGPRGAGEQEKAK
jgi:hypothetical protein